MTSQIDITKPVNGSPILSADVRDNFATAASEISALQAGGTLTGPLTIGDTGSNALTITPGAASGNAVGFSQSGSAGYTFDQKVVVEGQLLVAPVGGNPLAVAGGATPADPVVFETAGLAGFLFYQPLGVTSGIGLFGVAPVTAKPTVTGSHSDGTALASLLTALASYGLITDNTTP